MSNFPLYHSMLSAVKPKDLTIKQKDDFISKLKHIDDNGTELIYALIKYFEIEHDEKDKTNVYKLPYAGEYTTDGNIVLNLENFPVKLKQVLYKFINIHID